MSAELKIKKRNGAIVDFDEEKISLAVQKAFLDVLKEPHTDESKEIAATVHAGVVENYGGSSQIADVEAIQDSVERSLMGLGYFDVAKAYIIYRYEHEKIREEKKRNLVEKIDSNELLVKNEKGSPEIFSSDKIKKIIRTLLTEEELKDINMDTVLSQLKMEVYDGITTTEISRLLISVVRAMIERDPMYDALAARLLLRDLYEVVLHDEALPDNITDEAFVSAYQKAFVENIKTGVAAKKYDEVLLTYDLEKVAQSLMPDRDRLLRYLGVQTLNDRYFARVNKETILETPQFLFMRVGMGLAQREQEKEKHAVQFYNVMSKLQFIPSTPTLFHSGTPHSQLSSCYLNTVEDDLDNIFKVFGDNANLSKWAGGIGTDWTNIRATGALIKKAGFGSQGVVPFLKIANDVTVAINRSGRRRGATAVYLENWHYDIIDFLELRKNTGDERRRTHDINTATWISDLFMKRVREGKEWTLFSPDETPDLHHIYGKKFEQAYERYEQMASEGKINVFKKIPAADLWKKMLGMLYETGHPWPTFKDPSNIRSPQDHVGVVHNSNLCTEITLNTSKEETAVCNLGSVNFSRHVTNGVFDKAKVKETVTTAMRMLDNVIDINFYPTKEAKHSNMQHRPVGLGVMGFQDALYQLDIDFASERCVAFADESMEVVSYYAILASVALAKERGAYQSFKGSKWDRGLLPIDTIALLEEERGEAIEVSRDTTMDWEVVRNAIKEYGMRNSNCMAIAPTATISNIAGSVPSIEPVYKNIFVEANISGDFTMVNPYLVRELKAQGLWNEAMLNELKYNDGSIARIAGIPEAIKNKFKEVFEIDMRWLVRAAAYRGKWIDQSQSLNIFFGGSSGKELSEIYFYGWKMGLKTTYYLRSLAATQVEKSTVSTQQYGSTHTRGSGKAVDAVAATKQAAAASSALTAAAHAHATVEPRKEIKLHRAPEVTCESCQ